MEFSVAYSFAPGLIDQLAQYKEVTEVFGKLSKDFIGGGRSSYTLRKINKKKLFKTVSDAHKNGIKFNYLLNGASLNGIEQTRKGQRKIRAMLDYLTAAKVDSITVASPFLLKIIKKQYPHFKVRISVFAVVNSPAKAMQWEKLGADTICISAIACNRNFNLLKDIRSAVDCSLQLIVNASCLLDCAYELTHMNMLTNSSRSGDKNNGFCLDYCYLYCSTQRLKNAVNYIKSTWIRPEDLRIYEELGYDNFKILERSCPADLLLKRIKAYSQRHFEGNLLELVAPVAHIKKEQQASLMQRLRIIFTMLKPGKIKIKSLIDIKRYMEQVIFHDFSRENAPVYIKNKDLTGFLENLKRNECEKKQCKECLYCNNIADKVVIYNESYREETMKLADILDNGIKDGSLW